MNLDDIAAESERIEALADNPDAEPLAACVCGGHYFCPDGWHTGDELPCSCTPDCALEDDE